jgi:hypothetical protein
LSDERIESSLAVVPWAALYSRLDATELSSTHEQPVELDELLVIENLPTDDLPQVNSSPATWRRSPPVAPVPVMFPPSKRRAQPRPSPVRASARQLGWLETPVIHLSHIAVLVVSGTMFGIGLSAFALELLASLPGLEFLKL